MKNTDGQTNVVSKFEFYSIVTSLIGLMSSVHFASTIKSERVSSLISVILVILLFVFVFYTLKAKKALSESDDLNKQPQADNKTTDQAS